MLSARFQTMMTGFAGFFAGLVPVALALVAALFVERQDQLTSLKSMSDIIAYRAETVLSQTYQILVELEDEKPDMAQICSDAHISEMRLYGFSSAYVRAIAVIERGRVKCSTGNDSPVLARNQETSFRSVNGLNLWFQKDDSDSDGSSLSFIEYGNHRITLDPKAFVDVYVLADDLTTAMVFLPELEAVAWRGTAQALPAVLDQAGNYASGGRSNAQFRGHSLASSYIPDYGALVVVAQPARRFFSDAPLLTLSFLGVGLLSGSAAAAATVSLIRRQGSLEFALKRALMRRDELFLTYQPIVDLKTGRVIGAEALVRWRTRDGRIISPDLFIDLAETTGQVTQVTDYVLRQATEFMRRRRDLPIPIYVAVNISPQDISREDVMETLLSPVRGAGVPMERIVFEITERGFLDLQKAESVCWRLRRQGVRIAIDDFGTGFSSLSHLQSLPVHTLKIDKSFIDAIGRDAATSGVVPHVVGMAKALGLQTVAEGIEDASQAEALRELGVDYGQGWHFAHAMTEEAFVSFIYQHSKTPFVIGRVDETADTEEKTDQVKALGRS